MNVHEYQAKALFEKYGVPVPKGAAARTPDEFINALAGLPEGPTMVKSQIHAGGRGKGAFTDGFKGGVKFCRTKAEAKEVAARMLGNTLVTLQTGPAGRKVQTIYFTAASDIKKEYYVAILLDRARSRPVIVASTEGGVEIEKVAHEKPEKIFKVVVDPAYGLADFQVRELVTRLGLAGAEAKNASRFNGAGLAMSTMDIIKHFGGSPANFLDVGGGASREQVVAAFKIILGDPKVRGI